MNMCAGDREREYAEIARAYLQRLGVPIPPELLRIAPYQRRRPASRFCEVCGVSLEGRLPYTIYCSRKCRIRAEYARNRRIAGLTSSPDEPAQEHRS
jgi:hypothetical protein